MAARPEYKLDIKIDISKTDKLQRIILTWKKQERVSMYGLVKGVWSYWSRLFLWWVDGQYSAL